MTTVLEQIRAREQAATPGPWMVVYDGLCHEIVRRENGMRIAWVPYDFGPIDDANNAAFIAAARDDIPWLLARVRELDAQAARDANVADAVERWVGALGYVTETRQSDWGPLADAFKAVCDAVNDRRAALAAREAE